jgi:hypothetical protein
MLAEKFMLLLETLIRRDQANEKGKGPSRHIPMDLPKK